MVKVFIDTNTIVHWIIIKKMIEERGENVANRYRKLRQSYELMGQVLTGRFKNVEFYISYLTLAEMTKALVDFIVYEKMRLDGVAAVYWSRYFKDYLLTDEEFESFIEGIIEASNVLEDKLNIITDVVFDLEYYPFFVARTGLSAHDAILLTTAIKHGMNYFVTMDRDFHELTENRRIRDNIRKFFESINFQIVKPQRMIEILNRKN
ncbi:hypothetical protein [Pyrococcus kukulkanii]|uniref:hypothetical protein n=1 Tax=Pyrococcus kukulkanii TaxID=1609559 RepID=UPI00356AFA53